MSRILTNVSARVAEPFRKARNRWALAKLGGLMEFPSADGAIPITFDAADDCAKKCYAQQCPYEVVKWVDFVRRREFVPGRILEIGSGKGGFSLFMKNLFPKASIFTVGMDEPETDRFSGPLRFFRRIGAKIAHDDPAKCSAGSRGDVVFIAKDLYSQGFESELRSITGPEPMDLVVIDAGHWYEEAKWDVERFTKFLRPGGLLFFHDINMYSGKPPRLDGSDPRLVDFWKRSNDRTCAHLWDDLPFPKKTEIRHSSREGIGLAFLDEAAG